ncbi:hypothetical protein LTS08_002912 [Lithohypha guttulata]|nr:hypothetical protein LTS08_002912 [Lithohypha guttulata]
MRPDILCLVLSSSPLSPENASRAVTALPDGVEPVVRREMMVILLNAGAYGTPLENELVTAVRDNDNAMIAILRGQGRPVNFNISSALVAAVQAENVALLEQLLAGVSDQAALQAALPYVCGSNKVERLEMTKLLVGAQVKGVALHSALIRAVCDDGIDRDDELVNVLIRAGADPSFNESEVLRYVVDTGDSTLFERLMKGPIQVLQTSVSMLLTSICAITAPNVRYRFTVISLQARPVQHAVSAFLSTCLSEKTLDPELIKLLITAGQPDINFRRGELLEKATYLTNLEPLRQLVKLPSRTEEGTRQALARIFEIYGKDDHQTAQRVEILMCSGTHKAVATQTLEAFVEFWSRAQIEGGKWPLGTIRVLLSADADFGCSPELANTISRCCATPLIQLLLQYKPSAAFIDAGLQGCIYVKDASNRDTLIGIFIDAGATREGISKSLVLACEHDLEDSCATLIQARGDPRHDGHRPLRDTVAHCSTALLRMLLEAEKSCTNVAFVEAKRTSDLNRKHAQFEVILAAGVPLHLINDYLVELFHVVELDGRLIKLLLDNNADVHAQLNICFLRATLLNNLEVLSMLFGKASSSSVVADRCLELCADQQHFKNDFFHLLSFLSSCTSSISVLNSTLKQASHAIKNDATMRQLLPILLEAGADPNDDLGIVLNSVCEYRDFETVAILTAKANIDSRSRALHYLLQSTVYDKVFVKVLDSLMGLSKNSHPSFLLHADRFPPPLKTFLTKRPTSTGPLRRMLEHKCQALSWRDDGILFWGMQQTNVSDECLETLIRLGANVNFRDADSGQTVLLRAIKGKRRFVETLLKHGANSSITDKNGMSPLLSSSHIGDAVIASLLIKYGAAKNDGSLHHAVRKLNVCVVEVLLKNGHDANHPSPTVHGRIPLAELFLCGKVDLTNHHAMGNVISSLLRVGADMKRPVSRKPLIYWAFDNTRPIQMVEGLMQAYLHRHIDTDWNLVEDDGYIYSPTMWVQKRKFQGPHELGDQLLVTLRNYGANRDVFYRLHGTQPDDARGMPPALAQQESDRKVREAEVAAAEANHHREMQRIKEQGALRQKVQRERQHHELTLAAEAEAAKQHQLHARHVFEIEMQRERDDLTFQNMQRRLEIERQSRDDETRHLQNLKRLEYDSTQQKLALESKSRDDEIRQQQRLGGMAIENTKQRLALEATGESQRAAIRQRATDTEVAARQKLLKSEEHAGQMQHSRMMRQLEYAKAQPVGLPYKAPAGFITGS